MKNSEFIRWSIAILVILLAATVLAGNRQPTIHPEGKGPDALAGQTLQTANDKLLQHPKTGEQIKWQVIAAGGAKGTSTNFQLSGTAGQTATGAGTSTSYKLLQGYWQNFVVGPAYTCGDANGDASVNISDAVYLIGYIFSHGPAPNPLAAGDANCDVTVNISDAVYLIAYIFSHGPAPCATCK